MRTARDRSYFLDEVGRFTPAEQAHWLECLSDSERAVNARAYRIFASTSEDLELRARDGSLRSQFAKHLLRFQIHLVPLRERPGDIGALASFLADRIGGEMGRERVQFERAALNLLRMRTWTGNVRELASVIEKLVAFSPGGEITKERVREVLGESPCSVASLRNQKNRREREELVALLEGCGGNLAEVARRLGISRGAVIYRAQKHGLLPKSS